MAFLLSLHSSSACSRWARRHIRRIRVKLAIELLRRPGRTCPAPLFKAIVYEINSKPVRKAGGALEYEVTAHAI